MLINLHNRERHKSSLLKFMSKRVYDNLKNDIVDVEACHKEQCFVKIVFERRYCDK